MSNRKNLAFSIHPIENRLALDFILKLRVEKKPTMRRSCSVDVVLIFYLKKKVVF